MDWQNATLKVYVGPIDTGPADQPRDIDQIEQALQALYAAAFPASPAVH